VADEPGEDVTAGGTELDALLAALALKDERRTGWQLRGVRDPESVAAHSWGVAYLCVVFGGRAAREFGEPFDVDRAVRLAVVHDLAEAETGDVPLRADTDPAERADNRERERAAMDDLAGALPETVTASWEEYEGRDTPEATFVAEMDVVEMCLQALAYERAGRYDPADGEPDAFGAYDDLDEFFATAGPRLETDLGRRLFDRIHDRYEAAKAAPDGAGTADRGRDEPGEPDRQGGDASGARDRESGGTGAG